MRDSGVCVCSTHTSAERGRAAILHGAKVTGKPLSVTRSLQAGLTRALSHVATVFALMARLVLTEEVNADSCCAAQEVTLMLWSRAVLDGFNQRSSLKCCHSAVKCPTELCFNHWPVERDINDKRLDEPRERAHTAELPSSSKHENQRRLTMSASKEGEH